MRSFKKFNSQLARRICFWFKKHRNEDLSFGAILDKYCEKGMGRRYVADLLMDMTGKNEERLRDIISIKTTPLWEAWKAEVAQGRCSFQFNSKFSGNKFHGNRGKLKTRKKSKFVKTVEAAFICSCGHAFKKQTGTTGKPNYSIALKAIQCPKCGEFKIVSATFEIDNNKIIQELATNYDLKVL